ncbi:MAG: hypothetical protein JNK16_01645 [Phycisphaerales bacterium]|nr:hypothetical protein [Phycisphaerales bacterium]
MAHRLVITALLIAACAGAMAAEPEIEETSTPLTPAETEPDPWLGDDEPLLAGPRLADGPEDRTLVRFEFNGNLRRLDRTPEEAALDALNLPGEARDQADEILQIRRTALDEFVRSDLDILLAVQSARQAGNKPQAPVLVEAVATRVEGINGPIPLRQAVARTLPESERREFHRMIDEYWRALVLDEAQQAQARKEKMTLAQARTRVWLNATGTEVRRAFERQYKPRENVLTELAQRLSLSADQEAKVGVPIRELADRTKSKPNAREVYDLTHRVLPQLDPAQRRIWSWILLGVSPVSVDMMPDAG